MPRRVSAVTFGGFLALAAVGSIASAPSPTDGLWEGSMVYGATTHLIRLDLGTDSSGIVGRIDLPDQYAMGYALRKIRLDSSVLSFEFPEVLPAATFTGTVERGRIRGTFTSALGSHTRHGTFEVWRRPRSRLSYRIEEVHFQNADVTLRGSLLLPTTAGPHPAVVFLHGSGPQTRDSYIRYFADQFARQGVAALIYDKRNTDRVDIPPWLQGSGSFSELASDAVAGARLLTGRADIDPRAIGLWGFSQGAWLAPLAASTSRAIGYLILICGGGVTPAEQELYDDEVKLRAAGFADTVIEDAQSLLRLADTYIRTNADADWERFHQARLQARVQPWFGLLDRFPLTLPREAPAWAGPQPDLDYDPRPVLARTQIPTLVILGESDELTPSRQTAHKIAAALKNAENPDYTIRMVPAANHGLWVPSGQDSTWLDRRPAPGWVDEMLHWVLSRVRPDVRAARRSH